MKAGRIRALHEELCRCYTKSFCAGLRSGYSGLVVAHAHIPKRAGEGTLCYASSGESSQEDADSIGARMKHVNQQGNNHSRERALVIIPTYDEADNIAVLIKEVLNSAPGVSALVVDDASPDGTGRIVDDLAAANKSVAIIHRPSKLGLGSAYRAGFSRAISEGFELILTMDADFSHDPKIIPELLAGMTDHDVMIGSRYVRGGGTVNWDFKRRLLSHGANRFAKLILRFNTNDNTSGFRCYHRRVLESVRFDEIQSSGYSFLVEILYRCTRMRFTIGEYPITFVDRRFGKSKLSRGEILQGVKTLFRLRLARRV
jgi:dolichol-phosphate mannosyltransferase